MKVTVLDFAIVFTIANVMLAGISTKNIEPEFPICNADATTTLEENTDPRCALFNKKKDPGALGNLTVPVQTL